MHRIEDVLIRSDGLMFPICIGRTHVRACTCTYTRIDSIASAFCGACWALFAGRMQGKAGPCALV
jgi:hypothetical protein